MSPEMQKKILGEEIRSLILDMITLKCLLDIQVELLSRQLVFGVQ